MTIDGLGRAAGSAARRKASLEVEPAMMLRQLRRTHRTRNVLAVSAGVVVVAVAALLLLNVLDTPRALQPGSTHTPTPSADCPEGVTCLGDGQYRLNMDVPVTVTVPQNYNGDLRQLGPDAFEDYRNDTNEGSGMTIMENATAAANDATWSEDPSGGTTADSMATWFTQRPFLQHASKQPITVAGYHGWLLTGSVRPGAVLRADKAGHLTGPTFRCLGATAGIAQQLPGEYVVLDTPDAGVTVIWFWTGESDPNVLADSTSYLDHMTFG
jgi:hypothetical protein